MKELFFDEINCIKGDLSAAGVSGFSENSEVYIISNEASLALYCASYCAFSGAGRVNLAFLEPLDESSALFKEVMTVEGAGEKLFLFDNANLPEPLLADRSVIFVGDLGRNEKLNEHLKGTLEFSGRIGAKFIFVPVFSFDRPHTASIAAISEKEFDALVNVSEQNSTVRRVSACEKLCSDYLKKGNSDIRVLRINNLFGPLVSSPSKVYINEISETLINGNSVTVRKSDGLICYSLCYIRQAVVGIILSLAKGKKGNVYNCESHRATLQDIKLDLYNKFIESNPEFSFENDLKAQNGLKREYECLSSYKIKGLGFTVSLNLSDALYRTALGFSGGEYKGDFYIDVYEGKLQRVKEAETKMLSEIDRICRENDIKYFLVGGSMLGAVRSGSIIPWDDDIDIGMLREDFEKFKKVCPDLLGENMKYQSYKTDPDSHYIFDKIRLRGTYFNSKNTDSFEQMENGLFIDIFVFDKTANNSLLRKLHIFLLLFLRGIIAIRWLDSPAEGNHSKLSKILLPFVRLLPINFYHQIFERILCFYKNSKKSRFLIDGIGLYLKKGGFPIEWMLERVPWKYEGIDTFLPVGYEGYLTRWYGDSYLSEPPLSKRSSGHDTVRFDLGKYVYKETESDNGISFDLRGELY